MRNDTFLTFSVFLFRHSVFSWRACLGAWKRGLLLCGWSMCVECVRGVCAWMVVITFASK